MINLMREREKVGLRSPLRSPWRSKSPRFGDRDVDGNSTPDIGGYATPQRSTSKWADSNRMGYSSTPATPRRSISTWAETHNLSGYATTCASPRKSISNWAEANMEGYDITPRRDYESPRRSTARMRGSTDVTGFSTPQRITLMGREREVVEFRTPQHPLQGTNNWGADSLLLNHNLPKESLETSYLRFNALAYNVDDNDDDASFVGKWAPQRIVAPSPADFVVKAGSHRGSRRSRLLSKLMFWQKDEKVLGGDYKSRHGCGVYGGEQRRRWPQGWY